MKYVTLLFALSTMVACSATDKADAVLDCNNICGRYADCMDKSYDKDACASRCQNKSDSDADFRRQADQCQACITERACASATFNCTNECVSVVP